MGSWDISKAFALMSIKNKKVQEQNLKKEISPIYSMIYY